MGAYLVVIFLAFVALVCGMIMVYNSDKGSVKYGMYMVVIGVVLGVCCLFIHPKNEFVPQSWTDRY